MERTGIITMKGKGMTLLGPALKAGDGAPDFTLISTTMQEVRLADFSGQAKVFSVTPSVDTPVCETQARRFNEEAAKLPGAAVVNVSMDLPFALSRFCAAAGIDRVKTLSDHREASFGTGWGVLIKELRLLTRAVFVVDGKDRIRYVEIVPEATDPPDFDRALEALSAAVLE